MPKDFNKKSKYRDQIIIYGNTPFLNDLIDKKKYKWGKGKKLQTIKMEEMPKYISENIEKYKLWLDI